MSQFLELGLIARLACHDRGGWPYAVPVWFEWDGGRFWIIAAKEAAWVAYLERDPRVALCLDDPATTRRVLCQGRALIEARPSATGPWQAMALRMAHRYLGVERVDAYRSATAGLERWLIAIEPRRIVAWQGPGKGERAGRR